MKSFFSKQVVKVMYSRKTWSFYKLGVWLAESMFAFVGLVSLSASALLFMEALGMQIQIAPTDTLKYSVVLTLALLATTIAFCRSITFKPEQKVMRIIER